MRAFAHKQGCSRLAVELDGTESEEVLGALKTSDPIVLLLNTHAVSRLHASRRVFDALKRHAINTPVIHRITFPAGADKDEIVISTGSLVGGLLVGLGLRCVDMQSLISCTCVCTNSLHTHTRNSKNYKRVWDCACAPCENADSEMLHPSHTCGFITI